ncbi:MAG: hypothetical protein SOW43_06100 [Schaalia hyovaginalis]|nr:hypothetical protein [Schaalia hyovaginalis]MCI6556885.1 hypothetical protein [Schaalia hyovaginalis]MDY3093973.1 hypothetical protein [Schaalia hyovaginalis]
MRIDVELGGERLDRVESQVPLPALDRGEVPGRNPQLLSKGFLSEGSAVALGADVRAERHSQAMPLTFTHSIHRPDRHASVPGTDEYLYTCRTNTSSETETSMKRVLSCSSLALLAIASLSACSSGNSIEGTYFGTAGDTALILESGGKCGYTDSYDPDEGLDLEISEDCSWSLSGSNLTLVGVSNRGSLTGFVGDDGSISIPDQQRWRGEIYSKK